MKRVISVMLAAMLVLSSIPLSGISDYIKGIDFSFLAPKAKAADEPLSGMCGENVNWSLDIETGVLTISGSGAMADVHLIPWSLYQSNIKSISIQDNITNISDYIFADCRNLTSVTIGNSVTSIGEKAFYNCNNLTSVTIPDSVTSLEHNAFSGCRNLASIQIGNNVTNIGYSVFLGTAYYNNSANWDNNVLYVGNYLIEAKVELSGAYTIKNGTKCIANSAFGGCTNLTSVLLPDSITSIGSDAFYWCKNLTSIIIPNSVTDIGDSAFYGCSSLVSITIPDSVIRIGYGAFGDTAYYNDPSNWDNNVLYIGNCLIKTKKDKSDVYAIRNGTKCIASLAFSDCSKLTAVTIPYSVNSIGYKAFTGCAILENVIILNNSVLFNGNEVFDSNTVLKCYLDSTAYYYAVENGLDYVTDNEYITLLINKKASNANEGYNIDWQINTDAQSARLEIMHNGQDIGFSISTDATGSLIYKKFIDPGEYYVRLIVETENGTISSRSVVFSSVDSGLRPAAITEYNGHIYALYNEYHSWNGAKNICERFGGHLMTIGSEDEQNVLQTLHNQFDFQFAWLGATDCISEGLWQWVDDTEFNYSNWGATNWGDALPDNYEQNEHYLEVMGNLEWNDLDDYNEDQKCAFICEFDMPSAHECAKTIYYNNHTYEFYTNPVTWKTAKLYAEKLGGHLATITSQAEQDTLFNNMPQNVEYWIGLTDEANEGNFSWITGEALSYTFWDNGQPDNSSEEDYCSFNTFANGTGNWNDAPEFGWENAQGFIVEYDSTVYTVSYNANGGINAPITQSTTAGTTINLTNEMPSRKNYIFRGWATSANSSSVAYSAGASYFANLSITLYAVWEQNYLPAKTFSYNGNVYEIYPQTFSWEDADKICKTYGGHLATITDSDELNAIIGNFDETMPYGLWIGLTDKESEGQFKWVTGEEFSFSNWDTTGNIEPNNDGDENYGMIYSYDTETNVKGCWNDSETENLLGFICEYENTARIIAESEVNSSGCKYCLVDSKMTWTAANELVKNTFGGRMATIKTAEDADLIKELLTYGNQTYYWIGLTRYDTATGEINNDFSWGDGSEISYSEYLAGEPNGATYPVEFFTEIDRSNGLWDDVKNMGRASIGNTISYGYIFEVKTDYVVTYNANGGTNAPNPQNEKLNIEMVLSSEKPIKVGYMFKGWSTSVDASEAEYAPGDTFNLNTDTTLYAVWAECDHSGDTSESVAVENGHPHRKLYECELCGTVYDRGEKVKDPECLQCAFEYSTSDGIHCSIQKYTGSFTNLVIPETIDGLIPISISSRAFSDCTTLESIVIPEGIEHIRSFVFERCENLHSVSFPVTLKTIGFHAFNGCSTLEAIYIKDLTAWCKTTFDGEMFVYSHNLYLNNELVENLVIPGDVSVVNTSAFYGCKSIKTVELHDGIEYVGDYAFSSCKSLESIELKSGIKSIGKGAFRDCINIDSVEIPESAISVNEYAFYRCKNLTSVVIPHTVEEMGKSVFLYGNDDLIIKGYYSSAAEEYAIANNINFESFPITSMKIAELPDRVCYSVGEELDPAGIMLEVEYDDGYTALVNGEDAEFSYYPFERTGTKKVRMSFMGYSDSFNVYVTNAVLDSVSVSKAPQKTVYNIGESFDSTGMELTVVYTSGVSKTIKSGFNCDYDFGESGTRRVSVSYSENGATKTAYTNVSVNSAATVYSENASVNAGEQITVPVMIKDNTGLMGFSILLKYDSTMLEPVSVNGGDILSAGSLQDSIGYSAAGEVTIVWTGSEDMTSDGKLFDIVFKAKETATGVAIVNIAYSQNDTFNELYNDVSLECKHFTVIVNNSAPIVSVADVSVNAGENISVPVSVERSNGFGVCVFSINYDSGKLTPVSVDNGLATVLSQNIGATPGTLTIIINSVEKSKGDGKLFSIQFTADNNASGNTEIGITSSDGTNCKSGNVSISNESLTKPVKISADDVSASVGKTVKIPLMLSNNHGIMGFKLNVQYNAEVLSPVSVSRGVALSAGTLDNNIGSVVGNYDIIWNSTSDFCNNGEILILEFAVKNIKNDVDGKIKISYSQADTFNENWQDVELDCSDINIKAYSARIFGKYILGLAPKTFNTSDLLKMPFTLNDGDYLDNIVPAFGNYLGTGSKVELKNSSGSLLNKYTVIVYGDLDGDGVRDVLDAVIAERVSSGNAVATIEQAYAATFGNSEEIDINTYQNVVNMALAG